MNFKKSESGRSMVEMLGVLAIIGVLSVGGIAGYSLSMRRHRANQILDAASKFALVTYSKCLQKVMDGKIDSITATACKSTSSYEYEGLGTLPAGVRFMMDADYETDATTGVDTSIIQIVFDDDKLCQAVASIAGSKCNWSEVYIKIKQN